MAIEYPYNLPLSAVSCPGRLQGGRSRHPHPTNPAQRVGPALNATIAKAKLHGLIVDRKESGAPWGLRPLGTIPGPLIEWDSRSFWVTPTFKGDPSFRQMGPAPIFIFWRPARNGYQPKPLLCT
jgi:hypothetical protein